MGSSCSGFTVTFVTDIVSDRGAVCVRQRSLVSNGLIGEIHELSFDTSFEATIEHLKLVWSP